MFKLLSLANNRKFLFYILVMGMFTLLIYFILRKGVDLESGRDIIRVSIEQNSWSEFVSSLTHNLTHPLAILLIQIATIIMVARISWTIAVVLLGIDSIRREKEEVFN